jgi:eukaryotic-like serine/threonine-protein kinase
LRGDLDAIVAKALAKVPESRYASAEAFARDLERWLAGESVLARPEAPWRRAARFVRRHRVSFGLGLSVLVLLSGALGAALWQARVARVEADMARAVQAFLEDILLANGNENTDPVKARATTARELLDRAATRIDSSLDAVPAAKLRLLELVARLYADFRLDERAVDGSRKVVDLTRKVYGPDDPRVALALAELANALGTYAPAGSDAESLLVEASAILNHRGDRDSVIRAHVLRRMANYYTGRDETKAVDLSTEAVQLLRRKQEPETLVESLMTLGIAREGKGQYAEAEAALVEAGIVAAQVPAATRHLQSRRYAYLGRVQWRQREYEAAEASFRSAFAEALAFSGQDHADTIQTEYRLGAFLFEIGKTREGLALLQSAETRAVLTRGADDTYAAMTAGQRGAVQARYGQLEAGSEAQAHWLELNATRGSGSTAQAGSMVRLAHTYTAMGRFAAARAQLDQARAIYDRTHARADLRNAALAAEIELLLAERRPDQASVLAERIAAPPKDPDPLPTATLLAALARADIALARGDAAAAIEHAAPLVDAIANHPQRAYMPETDWRIALVYGKALAQASGCAEALQPLRRALALAMQLFDGATSPSLADTQLAVASCELALDRRDEARVLFDAARVIHANHVELGPQYRKPLAAMVTRLGSAPVRPAPTAARSTP